MRLDRFDCTLKRLFFKFKTRLLRSLSYKSAVIFCSFVLNIKRVDRLGRGSYFLFGPWTTTIMNESRVSIEKTVSNRELNVFM